MLITVFFCAGTEEGAGRGLERVEAELGVVDGGSKEEEEEEEEEVGAALAGVIVPMSTSLVAIAWAANSLAIFFFTL